MSLPQMFDINNCTPVISGKGKPLLEQISSYANSKLDNYCGIILKIPGGLNGTKSWTTCTRFSFTKPYWRVCQPE
jgi:hypothetical protein